MRLGLFFFACLLAFQARADGFTYDDIVKMSPPQIGYELLKRDRDFANRDKRFSAGEQTGLAWNAADCLKEVRGSAMRDGWPVERLIEFCERSVVRRARMKLGK